METGNYGIGKIKDQTAYGIRQFDYLVKAIHSIGQHPSKN
jgi:hypothetical protein